MTKTEQLAAIRHQPTRYELEAIETGTGRRLLVCYIGQRSRFGILRALRNRAQLMTRVFDLGENDQITWRKPARDGCDVGGWHVRFTGRTKREAIMAGELDYIGDHDPDDGRGDDR